MREPQFQLKSLRASEPYHFAPLGVRLTPVGVWRGRGYTEGLVKEQRTMYAPPNWIFLPIQAERPEPQLRELKSRRRWI